MTCRKATSKKARWAHSEVAYKSVILSAILALCSALLWAQQYTKSDRQRALGMLRAVAEDVQKHYYDPKMHGVNWDAKLQQAKENIEKADSMNGALSEIAALLDSLNDSHTFFIPPPRTFVPVVLPESTNLLAIYGFQMGMVGDRCFVMRVRPGSDAEKKEIKVGDQILAINGHAVTRKTLWRIDYIYDTLQPQRGIVLTRASEAGQQQQTEVVANLQPSTIIHYTLHQGVNWWIRDMESEHQLMRPRYFEKGDALLVVKVPEFLLTAYEVDDVIGKMRKHRGVVIDLRDNPGGSEETLGRLLGGIFQNDLKIFDRVRRDSTKAISATGRHHDAFTGRLAVLINYGSASASELFARVVQLQKRGFIIGDRSSGMVMEARHYPHETFTDSSVYYGASITDANLLMADGNSLEHVGVEPDIMILPTATELASGRDPMLSRAASLVGSQLTPEEAGALFPYEGPK